MRILQVRFKNLNSLVGEWNIDLTHPAFAADGIFAITGPTGAGKTTILDAICLALYGRTPRLNKVSKSGNEIMSRQTGACFAEVTFETQAGRFRCHWSQHRARKNPTGEFQAQKHEIANADTGEIFESKLRGVAEQIEAATGMDFDRFTRSMLLAQGGFDTFLKAEADKRAPILEQITGTEIYSQISVRVHERHSMERKRLDTLQAELAAMQFLPPEEEQLLAESLALKAQQDAELTSELTARHQAIAWLEAITRLENELKALDRSQAELQTKLAAFAPEQERLRLANQALELAAEHAALTGIRAEQQAARDALSQCHSALPATTAAAQQAQASQNTASEQLVARKAEQQTLLPLIRTIHELDLKITEKETPIQTARAGVTELAAWRETLQTKQQTDAAALAKHRTALAELQALITTSQADEQLVEQLTGLRSRCDAVTHLSQQLAGKLAEITQAASQLATAQAGWQQQSTGLNAARSSLKTTQDALAEQQAALLQTLAGKDVAAWRKHQSALVAQNDCIAKALAAVDTLTKAQQASSERANRQAVLKQQQSTLTSMLATQTATQAALEKEAELLETQLTLLQRIKDLDTARKQLQDGEPCPLCGSKEHPFALANIPAPDATQQRLVTVRAEFKAITGEISGQKVRLAQLNKDLEQTAAALTADAQTMAEASHAIIANCAGLQAEAKLTTADPELAQKLVDLKSEISQQLIGATDILEAADCFDKELATLRDAQEKAKDSATKHERDLQAATHAQQSAQQLLDRFRKEATDYREQQSMQLAALQQEIEPYGITALAVETLDSVYEQLRARRDQWVARNKQSIELNQSITALDLQIHHQTEQIHKATTDLAKQQELVAELQRDQDALRGKRQALFADKNPRTEEQRLSTALESAEQNLELTRQNTAAANQALSQLQAKIEALTNAIQARQLQLQATDASFLARLTAAGFADEASYKSCCLPEPERRQLAQDAQALADQRTAIAASHRDKSQLLATQRQQQITAEPLADLKAAVVALAETQRDLQQQIGAIRQKLDDNNRLKQQQQQHIQATARQKCECARWELLHELIGSADGKKFRNFAQGLTFEMMVGHANRQLQKMTDRYLLIRHDAQPLELNVVDNYQAGEIRSTKNLSGGESFIVSLALALGLSHMASKNVRVDSLFLDEGFGTLDAEALEIALETLAGLQQDGKLIGVISHVPALKERISTQILITPQTGGRSQISGPGCSRLGLRPMPQEPLD